MTGEREQEVMYTPWTDINFKAFDGSRQSQTRARLDAKGVQGTRNFDPGKVSDQPEGVEGEGRQDRPRSVCAEMNPIYYELISRFEQLSGLPVVLNTSFNHSDEPW